MTALSRRALVGYTLYLTIKSGVESENTNHTWEETNTYSAYDYEK